jgi:hypothetical protein
MHRTMQTGRERAAQRMAARVGLSAEAANQFLRCMRQTLRLEVAGGRLSAREAASVEGAIDSAITWFRRAGRKRRPDVAKRIAQREFALASKKRVGDVSALLRTLRASIDP